MVLQPIHDISEICRLKGVEHAVLSPGSRCAPLVISFTRNQHIKTWTFSDERSAAFHALGMCINSGKPVVLVCTSGSAAYNYAPAIAEAYFQHVPLVVLTADRPSEWIDQLDGQTIRQRKIYGNHVKSSFQLPDSYDYPEAAWQVNRTVNEAINLCAEFPQGPVHINVPIREPFYPTPEETLFYSSDIRVIEVANNYHYKISREIISDFCGYKKVMIVAGQGERNELLLEFLKTCSREFGTVVVTDIISNCAFDDSIKHHDLFIGSLTDSQKADLQPDMLITFGKSVVSKNLKLFLRIFGPQQHWHIQPSGDVADTFQHLTKIIRARPMDFFQELIEETRPQDFTHQLQANYRQHWISLDRRTVRSLESGFANQPFSELEAVKNCIEALPANSYLHLANSMAVRWANFAGYPYSKSITVRSNRGTSGIDGSNSTAIGEALLSDNMVILITGDLAFFYDRNAFWNKYAFKNLRVIILNNHGGGIFHMIPGPAGLKEQDEYFITNQSLHAEPTAREFGFIYHQVHNSEELRNALLTFFKTSDKPKILEVKSNYEISKNALNHVKSTLVDQ